MIVSIYRLVLRVVLSLHVVTDLIPTISYVKVVVIPIVQLKILWLREAK